MDIAQHLLIENSKQNWDEVVAYVGEDPERMAELAALFFSDQMRLVQRSSQPFGVVSEKHPALVKPYLIQLVAYLKANPIDAVKRNIMRIFQFCDIPEEIEGELFEWCLTYLKDLNEPIAVKAFSMTVARKICQKYHELVPELMLQIEILVEEKVSKGVVSRGKKELKELRKLLSTHND